MLSYLDSHNTNCFLLSLLPNYSVFTELWVILLKHKYDYSISPEFHYKYFINMHKVKFEFLTKISKTRCHLLLFYLTFSLNHPDLIVIFWAYQVLSYSRPLSSCSLFLAASSHRHRHAFSHYLGLYSVVIFQKSMLTRILCCCFYYILFS